MHNAFSLLHFLQGYNMLLSLKMMIVALLLSFGSAAKAQTSLEDNDNRTIADIICAVSEKIKT
jgi:hypothetical protein